MIEGDAATDSSLSGDGVQVLPRAMKKVRTLQPRAKLSPGFPEAERVFGKSGRAESSTDPAPYSIMETAIVLKPEDQRRSQNSSLANF